jgi:NitT/TauT family transport system substrate-binding protein/sulfonate transport system substrate-binding protein
VIGIVADVTKLPRDVLASFLLTNQDYAMAPDALPDTEAIQRTYDFLTAAGVLKTKLDAASTIDLRYNPSTKH